MKQHTRICALLLALAMLCSLLPQISWKVYADSYSGTCGENLTWRFDPNTGTLTIEGSGDMENYGHWENPSPWYDYRNAITTVSLPEGLTSIGEYAFYGCSSLTSVTIPAGVTSIGDSAFYGCSSLTSVTIPESVTSIGCAVFRGCSSLTSVTIPAGVTSIGDWAFCDCSSLMSVTIPEGVTSIGYAAFCGCSSLTSVTIPADVTSIGEYAFGWYYNYETHNYARIEGFTIYGYNGSQAQRYAEENGFDFVSLGDAIFSGTCGENLTWCLNLGTGTLTIEGSGDMENYDGAGTPWYVYRDTITTVSLPEGLTSIDDWAFCYCSSLTSVTIPEGVTSIGDSAFSECSSLMSVTIPESVTSINSSTFSGCSSLTSVTIPESVTSIGDWAFYYCSSLTSVTIPESVTSIGYAAFLGCSSLTSVTIPESVTSINDGTFSGCSSLTSVTIPAGVTSIGERAFYYCSSLTSVTILEGVTSIGDYAFYGCSSLTSVTIPASVNFIDDCAFGWYRNDEEQTDARIEGFTIYGYPGTAAEEYAERDGFKFVPLDPRSGFCDVNTNSFYYEPMLWAVENGITNGTSTLKFSPNDFCTRGQVVTFLWRAYKKPAPSASGNPFVDVVSGKYYYDPVCWAVEKTITSGTDKTHFEPNSNCTRAQVVTFLWRAAGSPAPKSTSNPFVDVVKDSYYYKAVLWAVEKNITNGTDKTHFSPNATCTRGQVVTFLYRQLG